MKKFTTLLIGMCIMSVFYQSAADTNDDKRIYFAGGCFWGVEEYFSRIPGVTKAISGYANGNTENPSYEEVCSGESGFAETVLVTYNPQKISLSKLVNYYFNIIDPTSINKQGNDTGPQYRTGIYYTDNKEEKIISEIIVDIQKKYSKKIVVEILPCKNFYKAEEYHQNYLKKNPNGYCHISLESLNKIYSNSIFDSSRFKKPDIETIKKSISEEFYSITQHDSTEKPFTGKYWNNKKFGIYVDIVTGEPLFSSKDKFDSGTGWPSFTKPIDNSVVIHKQDTSHGMERTEVRSRIGNSHLGHVFDDGLKAKGGMRYCINSGSLRFIPLEKMEEEGYSEFIQYVQ
ncbi:MAG: peptide-methionine (S)-S-oxide reductase MsrA [Desulfovibrio sp.]|nr:peptide-methionine (S)-S-oxide reductase MsrA [Desulfovibrio sp.]